MNDVRDGQEFHEAQVVDISTGDGYWQIAFADDRVTPSAYLLLQNAFAYDPSDRESGMDSHYVELNDQSQSVYGGVARAILWRDRLLLEWTQTGKESLGISGSFGLRFDISDDEFSRLCDIGRAILGDRLEVAV